MKKVLTVGVFDMLHIGHILLFKRARALGDHLIVAVQEDDCILKYKPGTRMIYTTEEREFMVGAIKYVDEVVTYRDVDVDIQNLDFDVFAKGPDQCHAGFQRAEAWCFTVKRRSISAQWRMLPAARKRHGPASARAWA